MIGNKGAWQIVRLGELVERHRERTKDPNREGLDRYVKVEHFDLDNLRLRQWGEISDGGLPPTFWDIFRSGMVLYPTRSPNLRQYVVPDFDGICGEKTLVLKSKNPDILLPELLPFIISSERVYRYCNSIAVGSVNAHVRWRDLAEYEFALPPMEEQRRITSLLGTIEELITSYEQCTAALSQVFRSGLENLLDIEKNGWNARCIGDLCEVVSGGTPSRNRSDYWGGEIPWVKTGEVNYSLITSTEECITEEGLKNSSARLVPKDSIVMALFGQGPTLGRVARLGIDATTNQACAVILPSKNINMQFLFYFLWREYERIRTKARGATQPNLNLSIVKSLRVPAISPSDQSLRVKELDEICSNLEAFKQRVVQTKEFRRTLKARLL